MQLITLEKKSLRLYNLRITDTVIKYYNSNIKLLATIIIVTNKFIFYFLFFVIVLLLLNLIQSFTNEGTEWQSGKKGPVTPKSFWKVLFL